MKKEDLALITLLTGRAYCPIEWAYEILEQLEGRPIYDFEAPILLEKHEKRILDWICRDLSVEEEMDFRKFWSKGKKL